MAIARTIIDWCDEKMEEALQIDELKAKEKAFVSGFVEGAIDAAIVLYVPVLIACYAWQYKATKK